MFLFENFILTQKTFYMISGFLILFLGTILNFSFSGLFKKKSQKISNFITITTLLFSSLCYLPFLGGFLNQYSTKSFYFLGENIVFGGLEAFLCLTTQIAVMFTFLVSKNFLNKLHYKQYYFNSLYLCATLALNMLIISKGFIPFVLSLETISICTLFLILAFKNREKFFLAYKYILISFTATIIMIFAYTISNNFNTEAGVLLVASKILFIIGLLIKCGFSAIFNWANKANKNQNDIWHTYTNTICFYTYAIAIYKATHGIFEIGSFAQIFFVLFFIISSLISAFKITRTDNFEKYITQLNCINFSIISFLFFIQNIQINCAAILLLLNVLVVNFGLLSSSAIININKKSSLSYDSLYGICYSNPLYCKLTSIIILIASTVVPSGIFTSKYLVNTSLSQSGLWSSIIMIIFAIIYTIIISESAKLIYIFYKKPNKANGLQSFKKRTNLNYSILLISIIFSILMFAFNGYIANIITSFL